MLGEAGMAPIIFMSVSINADTIQHRNQRYETCGDWWFTAPLHLEVRSSETGDWRYNFLVQVHEIIEAGLCKQRGIKEEDVTRFDKSFECEREKRLGEFLFANQTDWHPAKQDEYHSLEVAEPGDSVEAPYHREHVFATFVEKQLADQLGVDWEEYEKVLYSL